MNVRPAAVDDYPAIVRLLAEDEQKLLGFPSRITVNDLREWLSRTNLADDSWLHEDDGGLCAVGWCDGADGSDVTVAVGVVGLGTKGQGLGTELAARSEECAARRGTRRIHQITLAADTAAADLFLSRGYAEVRRFYQMAIELPEPPPAPAVEVEPMRAEEARAFHNALDEAFQDHWEHHSTPFEEWWGRHEENPNRDLGLWFVVRDGDEIAAVARNEANRNGGGYVGALGVRRAWRGKGYAKALLLHTFREFHARGMPRVTLGVDAQNPTGATHLYERVGMHVEQEHVVFEKVLP